MNKRSQKFYSKNEKEVMRKYGLNPVKMSGAGWIDKEDGENEIIIAQLKSTDASSYRIHLDELDKLEYHAHVSKKVPLFMIQFLDRDKMYFLISPEDLQKVSNNINNSFILVDNKSLPEVKSEVQEYIPDINKIGSNEKSRIKLQKIREKEQKEKMKNWKENAKKQQRR